MAASGKNGAVMEIASVRDAIAWQAKHSEEAFAPITARIIRAALAILETETATGRRIATWHGLSLEDAMPLRIAAGIHYLHLSGRTRKLEPVYAGLVTDQGTIDRLVTELAETYDNVLLPWLDGPPQTNEAGRSASFMAGLLWLSERLGPKFEMNEIGASAGVNTMMERYHYDLGGVQVGPDNSPMRIKPEWRGDPPPSAEVEIVSIRGCDSHPVPLADPTQALRLKSYVWADAHERMGRIEAAIALAGEQAPDLVAMDAADFVREVLAAPQEEGVTRVLYHSVMWQYMPVATRDAITEMMEAAAAKATAEKPLAWIRVETNRETFRHELVVRYWPKDDRGGSEPVLLAEAHPHGAWVKWIGG